MSDTPMTFEKFWNSCVDGLRTDGLYKLESVKEIAADMWFQGALHSAMELAAMMKERDELRKDAERYRWIKLTDEMPAGFSFGSRKYWIWKDGGHNSFDDAIDAAMDKP